MVMVDQTGVWLLASVVRGWSAVGAPQQLRVCSGARKRCNVIGGVSLDGRLYYRRYRGRITAKECARFLRQLLGQMVGKVLVIWDNYSAHRSKAVREVCSAEAERLEIVYLPAYAPELNASESIWKYMKVEKLGNRVHESLADVYRSVGRALESLRYRHDLLRSFFGRAGLDILLRKT